MPGAGNARAPRLVIRADANPAMGVGHLMRSLAVAETWLARGNDLRFLSACTDPKLCGMIESVCPRGLIHVTGDLADTQRVVQSWPADLVLLDGYQFDAGYQQRLAQSGAYLALMDDYVRDEAYHVQLVINPGATEPQAYQGHTNAALCLGPDYALLRPIFRQWRQWRRTFPDTAAKCLLTFGGGDSGAIADAVLTALGQCALPALEAVWVSGPVNPQHITPPAWCRVIESTDRMDELMAWADIAITGGGGTCWEMAYMGLPNCTLTLADNQRAIVDTMHHAGATQPLATHPTQWAHVIGALCRDPQQRQRMSHKGRLLVDGLGAERVCDALEHAIST